MSLLNGTSSHNPTLLIYKSLANFPGIRKNNNLTIAFFLSIILILVYSSYFNPNFVYMYFSPSQFYLNFHRFFCLIVYILCVYKVLSSLEKNQHLFFLTYYFLICVLFLHFSSFLISFHRACFLKLSIFGDIFKKDLIYLTLTGMQL